MANITIAALPESGPGILYIPIDPFVHDGIRYDKLAIRAQDDKGGIIDISKCSLGKDVKEVALRCLKAAWQNAQSRDYSPKLKDIAVSITTGPKAKIVDIPTGQTVAEKDNLYTPMNFIRVSIESARKGEAPAKSEDVDALFRKTSTSKGCLARLTDRILCRTKKHEQRLLTAPKSDEEPLVISGTDETEEEAPRTSKCSIMKYVLLTLFGLAMYGLYLSAPTYNPRTQCALDELSGFCPIGSNNVTRAW